MASGWRPSPLGEWNLRNQRLDEGLRLVDPHRLIAPHNLRHLLRTRFEEMELWGFVSLHVGQVGTVSFGFFDKVGETIDNHHLVRGGEGGTNVPTRRLLTTKNEIG